MEKRETRYTFILYVFVYIIIAYNNVINPNCLNIWEMLLIIPLGILIGAKCIQYNVNNANIFTTTN